MKVLHVLHEAAWKGGVESYVLNALRYLENAGVSVHLAAAGLQPGIMLGKACVTTLDLHTDAGVKELRKLISDLCPDVVHWHNVYEIRALNEVIGKIPTIATAHGYQWICPAEDFYQEFGRRNCTRSCGPACFPISAFRKCMAWRPAAAKRQYQRASWGIRNLNKFSQIISPSRYTARRFAQAGLAAEKSTTLPYFCPVTPLDAPRAAPVRPQITFLGRITPYKGIQEFLECLARLPTVTGKIVGNFDHNKEASIKTLASKLGCADRIYVQKWVAREELPQLFAETTVFIFPSIWHETLGIVGLEAMAYGVPVVAFNVGGVPDWLSHGETGYICSVKDTADMAARTQALLDDADLNHAMGRKSIEVIRQRFSPSLHINSLCELYDRAN